MMGMKWLEEKVEDSGMMDTYMDTKQFASKLNYL